jgi:glycosyltransferase involved in cell wall biosynthesis
MAAATVALYSGLVVDGDAISSSLRAKLAALRAASTRGLDVEVVAFCQYSDVDDPAVQPVHGGVEELIERPAFQRASVHVFEFGIYYQLFNVAHLIRAERMAAIYHNITPRRLISDPAAQTAVDRSLIQKHILTRMSHVACDSEFNRQDLLDFGIPADRLSVLPLPGSFAGPPATPRGQRPSSAPIRFLFVGRLVRAKGVLDLLAAARRLIEGGESGFELRLVGKIEGSDAETTKAIAGAMEDRVVSRVLRFTPNSSSQEVAAAYRSADVFVLPSYHEGYCVPVVEAFRAACPVITYDNSNLPLVSGGLAELLPTGDVDALRRAMQSAIERLRTARAHRTPNLVVTASGAMTEAEWRSAANQLVEGLQVTHDEGFVALVRRLLRSSATPERSRPDGDGPQAPVASVSPR